MKNEKYPPDGEIVVREVRESDRDAIIPIFNHYAATS